LARTRWGALLGFLGGMGFMAALDWRLLGPWVAVDGPAVIAAMPAPTPPPQEPAVFLPLRPKETSVAVAKTGPSGEPFAPPSGTPAYQLPAREIDPTRAELRDGHLVQSLGEGVQVELTLDPFLQEVATRTLAKYQVSYGAVVALDPTSGEILALAEYAHDRPDARRLALAAEGPAASLFKLVTASALVDAAGDERLTPESTICTHGGERRVSMAHLEDHPTKDQLCETLSMALGSSNNVAFARWTDRVLTPDALEQRAQAFLFNRQLPFVWGVAMSRALIPRSSRLGFARSGAGFEGTTLSPLHAGLIAATIANDGKMMAPRLVRRVTKAGQILYQSAPEVLAEVLSPDTARAVGLMMRSTIRTGTAKKFFERRGKPILPDLEIASKTGNLAAKDEGPERHYSWFVAFAPAESPRLAIASLVVQGDVWTVKGVVPAKELLQAWWSREREGQTAAH
jgi:cell division protein FtsI/penicillin-binding protein 2